METDYKDILRRYALHVGEYAETTYTEPDLSYNHITPDEADIINQLINEPKHETR